jgi:hypothetical protein
MANNNLSVYTRTSRAPLPFGALHPGSMFTIHAEKSRGLMYSRDYTVYRKAREEEGFYAYADADYDKVACLYPEDLVWPIVKKRATGK